MAPQTLDLETVATLVESWDEIRPLLQEVSRQTGLSRPESLLLYVGAMLAGMSEDEDEDAEPWRVA